MGVISTGEDMYVYFVGLISITSASQFPNYRRRKFDNPLRFVFGSDLRLW